MRIMQLFLTYFKLTWETLISASKKTLIFSSGFLEDAKDKAFEALKNREFTFVNDRFQNENNAVFGVF